jgi:hypothetical protein
LDAVRLDIVHHHLWGRAEAVRTMFRLAATAAAPVVFGYTAQRIGLPHAFALMLLPLAANGAIPLFALRTCPRDVATAVASESATAGHRP